MTRKLGRGTTKRPQSATIYDTFGVECVTSNLHGAAERRNLRSPRREPWGTRLQNCEPRSGGISNHVDVGAPRGHVSTRDPNADALGYLDTGAPRRLGPSVASLKRGNSIRSPEKCRAGARSCSRRA